MKKMLFLLTFCAAAAPGQGDTALLTGTISDPSGSAVPGAVVAVTNVKTKLSVKGISDDRGEYTLAFMPSGVYEVTVTKSGFKAATKAGVEIAAGVDATVNLALEVGQSTEAVTVAAGAEMVQATSAELSSSLTLRQVSELPTATRNAMELFTLLPGAHTTGSFRETYINGMPKEAINITIDGINTNDNWVKSADGFYSVIRPSIDSIEEATLSTSAAGADSTAQGGAQLKFVTRSGTGQIHGGVFWQLRNTFFNSNAYFNTINRLPRDIIKLNQGGFHLGGPIRKDKLMFFINYEIYRLPNSGTFARRVLPPDGQAGNFSYCPTTSRGSDCASNPSLLRTVNLLSLAQQANASLPPGVRPYGVSVDPIVGATLSQIWDLVKNGNLQNSQPANDFNRFTYRYVTTSTASGGYYTARLDYNLTAMHHLSLVLRYDTYTSTPDVSSGIVPIYQGTGTVLGSPDIAGQRRLPFSGAVSLRSALSSRLTNELRTGAAGGTSLTSDAVAPGMFARWRGFNPNFGYVAGVAASTGTGRQNAPVTDVADTFSWANREHQISLGGNWQSIGTWSKWTAVASIPTIAFGMASGDPAVTGGTAWLTQANLPGISNADLTSAGSMYAMLTGRVSWISQAVVEDEVTHRYAHTDSVDRNRQREIGFFAQDTWRVRPDLTFRFGARIERQFPFVNVNRIYSHPGIEGVWGVSGVGHLFQPGTLTGVAPTLNPVSGDAYQIPAVVLPSAGLAYQLPSANGLMRIFTGGHIGAAVLRAGYSIASTRAGGNNFTYMWGANRGPYYDTSVDPASTPQYFGPAGSVRFGDASFPSQPFPVSPQYPIAPSFSDELDEFDPHLKLGYVQSWNVGYQRELGRNTVVELRYTGNHGVDLWRQIDLNELNIFENGFLNEAMVARQNLAVANGVPADRLPFLSNLKSFNYGNQGLPGQRNLAVLPIAMPGACCADNQTAIWLAQAQIGAIASSIADVAGRLANLTRAGYPVNFFTANPAVTGGAYLMTNLGSSYYHAGQAELRRRLSAGLHLQGSYEWAHALVNGAFNNSASFRLPTTLRNLRLDRTPAPYDIRHTLKANWIYEFPFGPGRKMIRSLPNPILRRALEGWEMAGTLRIQSGQPGKLTSGRSCINSNDCGVVLHNLTIEQLQSMMGIYKSTGSNGIGMVYNLPLPIIQNSLAAFNQGGFTLDPNAPYIGPQTTAGEWGYSYFLRGPWQRRLDLSLIKRTKLREQVNFEVRAQALNVLNLTNFYLGDMSPNGATFGRITSAYRDMGNALDPGGRILEFVLRVSF